MPPHAWRRRLRWLGLALGLGLLGWAVLRAGAVLPPPSLWREHGPAMLLLAALVGANLIATGALFWLITRSFSALPPVPLPRMIELVAASALINYLPLGWPGPAARSAWLKLRHNLPIRQSLIILGIVLTLSVILALGVLLLLGLHTPWARLLAALMGLGLLSVLTARLAPVFLHRPTPAAWAWAPFKALDLLLGALRLWLAFRIIGLPIGLADALALGAADMVVSMLAITPNGLGLSEWAVGFLASTLHLASSPQAQLAKLVDRGLSVLVIIPAGLGCLRRLRAQ